MAFASKRRPPPSFGQNKKEEQIFLGRPSFTMNKPHSYHIVCISVINTESYKGLCHIWVFWKMHVFCLFSLLLVLKWETPALTEALLTIHGGQALLKPNDQST